jgi:ribosome maturation factor RimP
MDEQVLIEGIKVILGPVLIQANIELVDLSFVRASGGVIIKLLVDKIGGGINLDECAQLSRDISQALDEKDIIASRYMLEVSSPGLDRRLLRQKDFLRSLNKKAVFYLKDLVSGKCQWQGIISKVDEATVYLQVPGELLEIPLIKINKAQLVI